MSAHGDRPEPRTCPRCGAPEPSARERCTHCGALFDGPPAAQARRRRRLAAAGLAATVALVGAGAVLTASGHDRTAARDRAAAEVRAQALRARLVRIQAPHHGAARALRPPAGASAAVRLRARAALVRAAEASILRDARARERAGELDGPITGTTCGPIVRDPRAVPADRVLTKRIGRYDCLAAKRAVRAGTGAVVGELGHPFVLTADFDTFTYTWCRNTPSQSEAGVPLVFVRLERACLAATGRAMGTGYADVPAP